MLVLARKLHESIIIVAGDEVIRVSVARLPEPNRQSVRIGVDARPEVKILREEIFQRMIAEERERSEK